jgi:spartin
MIQPEAFILLTLANTTLKAGNTTYDGNLALECITVSVNAAQDAQTPARDVYLVLCIKSFETPLDPSSTIRCSIQNSYRYYSFLGGSGEDIVVRIREPSPHEPHVQEDLDTFDSILAQYAEFQRPEQLASAPFEKLDDLRGRVVLVNEDNREVVGELDNQFTIKEDPALGDKSREREPVIIEIPDEGGENAFVYAVPPGEEDMIIKGASFVRYVRCHLKLKRSSCYTSYAISGSTNLVLTAITSASSYAIKHSEPHPSASKSKSSSGTPPPLPPRAIALLTSERTRKGISTVHAMSGQAVQISTQTLGLLDKMIKRAVGSKGKRGRIRESIPMGGSTLSPGSIASPVTRSRSPSPVPPPYSEKPPLPPRPSRSPSPLPPSSSSMGPVDRLRKRDRFIISADMILTSIDDSAKQIMDVGGQQLNAVIGHKYGDEAAQSTSMLTGTAKNVGLVYIDMRGMGRRALIKRVGKEYAKARVSSASSAGRASGKK